MTPRSSAALVELSLVDGVLARPTVPSRVEALYCNRARTGRAAPDGGPDGTHPKLNT